MAGGGGGQEDLNLVPYLDIMVNLIMFMVTVTAYLVQLKEAPIVAPTYNSAGGGAGDQKPYLTVAISSDAMKVLGGSSAEGKGAEGVSTFAKGDYPGLVAQLRSLHDTIPDLADNLVVVADGKVPYKEVVKVMDVARTDKKGDLFPHITLGTTVNK